MSVLIASSEPFPGHADNTSYGNNHISAMVEYLLNCHNSYKEKENQTPTTAENGTFSSFILLFHCICPDEKLEIDSNLIY